MSSAPPHPPPTSDTKDRTWVLDEACPECGFDAAAVERGPLAETVRSNAEAFAMALRAPHPTRRRHDVTWSTLEYACHVRDVHRIFDERVRLMLDHDEPLFVDWDQDETARAERYDLQDPAEVALALVEAADAVATTYDGVPAGAWGRRGLRSNGSEFTVDSIARYHLHDVVHHLHDVAGAVTVAAYDVAVAGYREQTQDLIPDNVREALDAFAAALPEHARVLEIGSGSGRDARLLVEHGLRVRRTDVTPAFVEALRADGVEADLLDPLTDDLTDPARPGETTPYDGTWANACLLHVARADLPLVLTRLAAVTRPDGLLRLSLKEGDGEGWSTHGSVTTPRRFVYWREQPLRHALAGAGWSVVELVHTEGLRGDSWLNVVAQRSELGQEGSS
ncbi:class I SAM-dependent methyltransferase [Nocardioides sp.]|uniref:class I SAM-dependent methyltransferase n=1 Tax=Nocardioides sp. TaxID=35761 RepID=UPI00286D1349|nr:class I SAM-dependent methyltransferase [Nocardioides sp.]